jgi:4'-phosphopantetheinyl transferase
VSRNTALGFAQFEPPIRSDRQQSIELAPTEVDLWAYSLAGDAAYVDAWSWMLSREEMEHADGFFHDTDRGDYIVAHGVLRLLLAQYCGLRPNELAFGREANEKPFVVNREAIDAEVTFNLAHSHGRALLAIARNRMVGVDLEHDRDDFDPLILARHFFFRSELAAILASPPHLQRDVFFRHWVAKESVLKAQGVGLSLPLDAFWVTFETDDKFARVQSLDPAPLAADWFIRMLTLDARWHGAVTSNGEGWELRL